MRRRREPLGDDLPRALDLAYAAVASRPRSEAEMRARLKRAGAEPTTIDAAISRLRELRYLDDESFSKMRAASLARRGFGPRAIDAKLRQAGVPENLARGGIAEAVEGNEASLARAALERRLAGRSFASLDPKERLRLKRWLAGRGFGLDAIRKACAEDGL